jgi:hypothetical protein
MLWKGGMAGCGAVRCWCRRRVRRLRSAAKVRLLAVSKDLLSTAPIEDPDMDADELEEALSMGDV